MIALENEKKYEQTFNNEDIQIASKPIKRCSQALTIREIQVKIIMIYYYTTIRMAKIKNSDKKNAREDVKKVYHSYIVCENVKWQLLWKNSLVVLYKTKHIVIYYSVIELLGIYLRKIPGNV